jgi:hypothetical protein
LQEGALFENLVDEVLVLDGGALGEAGLVIATEPVAGPMTEVVVGVMKDATELEAIEAVAFIDSVVKADWEAGPSTAGRFEQ